MNDNSCLYLILISLCLNPIEKAPQRGRSSERRAYLFYRRLHWHHSSNNFLMLKCSISTFHSVWTDSSVKVTDSQRAFEMQVECRLETVLNYQKTLEKVCWPFVHEGRRRLLSRIRLTLASFKYRGVQFTDRRTKAFYNRLAFFLIMHLVGRTNAPFFGLGAKPAVHFVFLLQRNQIPRSDHFFLSH